MLKLAESDTERLFVVMKKLFTILCVALAAVASAAAQGEHSVPDSVVTENFAIYYRFDETGFDQTYLSNSETATHIKNYLLNSARIDRVTIYAWASPEGAYHHNVYLSRERAKTAKRFLLAHSPDSAKLNSEKIHISPQAENWPGLVRLVEENYHRHDRVKVLRILKDKTISDETRKWRLKQLDGGIAWRVLFYRYMPQLRSATWICVWAEVIDPLPEMQTMKAFATTAERPLPVMTDAVVPAEPKESRVPVAALRTNLLVPALNVGAEIPIGNRWSVGADYYYPWIWPDKTNKNCFEFLGGSLEGRYWFGKDRTPSDRLKGHSIGLYAAAGYYDFEKDFEGLQGEFVSTGLDYTYAVGLGRKKRVNLEFTLALGYIHAWNRTYSVPGPEGALYPDDGIMMFDYFGPTKAAVSFVVPIFGKEGRR